VPAVLQRQAQRIQAVLRDRFGLILHSEDREMSVYSLTISNGGSQADPVQFTDVGQNKWWKIPDRDRVHDEIARRAGLCN